MKLSEVQNLFKKQILAPQADPQTITDLKPAGHLPLNEAFEVYHQGYTNRLTEALSRTYETVLWVLGHDLFNDICARYIESQPSVAFNLDDYGSTFPEYLVNTSKTKGIPFLQDLASFERLYKEIDEAATPNPLPIEQVQEILHARNFKIRFIDAMGVFQSMYSVSELWKRRKEPPYMYEDVNWGNPESLLIYKKDKRVMVQNIDPVDAEVILELQEGKSASEALSGYADLMTPERSQALFQLLMKAGVIDDVTL
ncbi:MAG: putative DNA-binding domain-containing protein [Bdellovibrio sp.]|nr:putative DNA-binding domain-containing protein [Bdellovibrio sp.]